MKEPLNSSIGDAINQENVKIIMGAINLNKCTLVSQKINNLAGGHLKWSKPPPKASL